MFKQRDFVQTQPAFTCLKWTIETPTRTMSEICSKLTIKTPERHLWGRCGFFIVDFKHISTLFCCFYCWLWTSKYCMVRFFKKSVKKISHTEAYSEPYQISKMERFGEIVNGFLPLTIFAKRTILDIWQSSQYASNTLIAQSFIELHNLFMSCTYSKCVKTKSCTWLTKKCFEKA